MPNAIISTFLKEGLLPLVAFLLKNNYKIFSSGGTYKHILNLLNVSKHDNISEVSELTQFPEILGGRVKTLHPKIYGGLLSTNSTEHQKQIFDLGIPSFDLVVVNLYPFADMVSSDCDEDTAIENIDIGGVSLIRAAAKNYNRVCLLTNPQQYQEYINLVNNKQLDASKRKAFALEGFRTTMKYDTAITNYFSGNTISKLKYGANPQQQPSYLEQNGAFNILNGNIGFINVLDFIHGFLIVREIEDIVGIPTAVSMKHTSPAGIAIGTPLDDTDRILTDTVDTDLTPMANAFIKSRNCDPLSSFGDFIVCSNTVDVETARQIKRFVSDGIMAPAYTEEALELLKSKKGGKYIIVEASMEYYNRLNNSGWEESKKLYGVELRQPNNKYRITREQFPEDMTDDVYYSIVAANTSMKYTQSNNIAVAYNGQVIGIGSGQQNRVDCVRLACKKANRWVNRRSKVCVEMYVGLKKTRPKFQDRINIIYQWLENVDIKGDYKLVLASDGFFPFSDNIEVANGFNVKYMVQPGGSMRDDDVDKACKKCEISMYKTDNRMFYH